MKPSIKAALFSALIFPGAGHYLLKRYGRGCLFFAVWAGSLAYIINELMNTASAISEKILSGVIAPDPAVIANLLSATKSDSDFFQNLATFIAVGSWAWCIFDSYLLGKEKEKAPKDSS